MLIQKVWSKVPYLAVQRMGDHYSKGLAMAHTALKNYIYIYICMYILIICMNSQPYYNSKASVYSCGANGERCQTNLEKPPILIATTIHKGSRFHRKMWCLTMRR